MSSNTYLLDRLSRHQIFIQRFAGQQVKESLPILRQMAKEIRAALQRQDLTDFQTARLIALQIDIMAITSAAGVELKELMTANMTEFAVYEAQFTQKLLQGAVTVDLAGVSSVALGAAVTSAPMKLISGQKAINTTFSGIFDTFASGVSREVMTTVQAGITAGATNAEITRNVMSLVNTRTRAQAETVVRTAANAAGSVARAEVYKANADVLKGEEFSAVLDMRTTLVCAGNDSKIFPVGVGPMPPLHYGCVLGGSSVLPVGRVHYITKRPFNGEMVRITTLGNRVLTVTANHPVMTESGFVAAKLIKKGDNLVSGLSGYLPFSGGDNDQMVSSIQNTFDALCGSGEMLACPVPAAPEDFHGDVSEYEIGVVLIDVELSDSFAATFAHKYVEYFLKVRASGALSDESGFGRFDDFVSGFFASSSCGVSFESERLSHLKAGIIHSGLLLLASIPGGYSVGDKKLIDDACGCSELASDAGATDPAMVHVDHALGRKTKVERNHLKADAYFSRKPVDDASTDSSFGDDFSRLSAGIEQTDAVVDVELVGFSGHVFNLMCDEGVYFADGILTHNCRSVRVPVVDDRFAALREGATRASYQGPVSAQTTYNSWLKQQPAEFQNEVLGPERAKLFRSGEVSLDKFTDDAGRVYTLDELRAREGITLE